jgi:hypothetical protein
MFLTWSSWLRSDHDEQHAAELFFQLGHGQVQLAHYQYEKRCQ